MGLLRDRREEFEQAGVRPLAISRDSPWTHIAWAQALDLDFGLLSDWNAEAVRGFDVAHTYRGREEGAERAAFLIGADGTVKKTWLFESDEVPDFDVLLDAARAL